MRNRLLGVAATLVLVALAPAAAHAEPLGDKRAQAKAVMGQIMLLDASVGAAAEEYNAARIKLDEIQSEQRKNQRHLSIARASYGSAQKALQKRLLALYTSGESASGLEILLGAVNLSDFL